MTERKQLGLTVHTLLPLMDQGSQDDPEFIFFTLNTYQATFMSDTLCYDCKKWSQFSDMRMDKQMEENGQTYVEVEIVIQMYKEW